MSSHDPDESNGDWVKRYREANEAEAAMPSPATREAILAEGRRVAAARAANPTSHQFDTTQPAANQSRWKLAAVGTGCAALLAVVLMFPHLSPPSAPSVAHVASVPESAAAPAPTFTREAPESDALKNGAVTGARRAPAARSETLARKAQAPAAPQVDRLAKSTSPESQDAASGATLDAQSARTTSPSLAPPAMAAGANTQSLASPFVAGVPPQAALVTGVLAGDTERVTALLGEGMNPDQVDPQGRTALLLAVIEHRDDLVALLLAHHANPNASDAHGQTPLQRARLEQQLNIVHRLEDAGAH